MPPTLESYQRRFGYCPPAIAEQPAPGLGLVVVVPCHDEPDLAGALHSLHACALPDCAVEVIVVVNAAQGCSAPVAERTARLTTQTAAWMATHRREGLRYHLLDHPALPAHQAGVGLARKIGMDEAAARLWAAGNPAGIIAGYDADCRCSGNYLTALAGFFRDHPLAPAASVYFEHPLSGDGDARRAEGIVQYELFLRYYVAGLRFAGHPHPFHTLGSCMAVRAGPYLAQGGMNRRKAGEDFYFLAKFMKLGNFGEIRATTVRPAARLSHRVPFGTGRAMTDWMAGGQTGLAVYAPEIFVDLKAFLAAAPRFLSPARGAPAPLPAGLPPPLALFLEQASFPARLAEILGKSRSRATCEKHFFNWFDRFRVLKFAQFASERFYPRIPVAQAAGALLRLRDGKAPANHGPGAKGGGLPWPAAAALLARLREEERADPGG